jgi:hypothetical protein
VRVWEEGASGDSKLAAEVLDGALLELADDGLDDLLEAAAMAGQ